MPEIIMLIGEPASGKSTWRDSFQDEGHVVISSDDILDRLAAEENITYSEAFQLYAGRADKECKKQFSDAVNNGNSIIVDRTNMTQKGRAKFLSMVGEDYNRKAIVFRVPRDVLIERARVRGEETGKVIAPWIIDRMTASYVAPDDEEFDEIIYA